VPGGNRRRVPAHPQRRVCRLPGAGAVHDRVHRGGRRAAGSPHAPGPPGGDGVTLTVLLPQGQLFRGRVQKVVARGAGGSRGYWPRHVDFVTALVPSILSAVLEDGSERFFAVDGGVLVKKGDEVTVTAHHA